MQNFSYNADVTVSQVEHLSIVGRVCSITKRWTGIANDAAVLFLTDVTSDWWNFAFTINPTGTFHFDVWLVSSYSGGTPPKLGNRNFLFQSVHTPAAILVSDPTIELHLKLEALIERVIPAGAGPKSGGGSFGGDNLIHVPLGNKFVWELTNRSGSAQDIDVHILGFSGLVNSQDWTGLRNVP